MLNKDSFIKFMHMATSTWGTVPYANHFATQLTGH